MSQINKKFIKDDAVGAAKLLLENGSYLRSRNGANSANINVLKVDSSNSTVLRGDNEVTVIGENNVNITGGNDGTGSILLSSGSNDIRFTSFDGSVAPQIKLYNADGGFYLGLKAPNALAATKTYTLPSTDGTSGQVLQTDGSGGLSWASAGGGGANQTLSNLTDPTAVNQDLRLAATKSVVLKNSVYFKSRNAGDSADVDMVRLNSSGQSQFATPIVPDASNSRDLGADVNRWKDAHIVNVKAGLFGGVGKFEAVDGSLNAQLEMYSQNANTPQGNPVSSHIVTAQNQNNFGIYTKSDSVANSSPTGSLYIETGFKDAGTGDAGSINISAGNSSGGIGGGVNISGGGGAISCGDITLSPGDAVGSAVGGNLNLNGGGSATGNGGDIVLQGGTGGFSNGKIKINSEIRYLSSADIIFGETGSAKNCFIRTIDDEVLASETGNIDLATGGTSGSGENTGQIQLSSGQTYSSASNTGAVKLRSGNANGSSGNSGPIEILTGDSANNNSGDIILNTGASSMGTRGAIKIDARVLKLPTGSSDPTGVDAGEIYFNTTSGVIRVFDGTSWANV